MDIRAEIKTSRVAIENLLEELRSQIARCRPEVEQKISDAVYACFMADDALRQAIEIDDVVKCLRCQKMRRFSWSKTCECCGSGSCQVIDHADALAVIEEADHVGN